MLEATSTANCKTKLQLVAFSCLLCILQISHENRHIVLKRIADELNIVAQQVH